VFVQNSSVATDSETMATAAYYAPGPAYLDEYGYPHYANVAYPAQGFVPAGGVIYTDAQGNLVGPDGGPPPALLPDGSFAPGHAIGPKVYDENGVQIEGRYSDGYPDAHLRGGNRMIARPPSPRCPHPSTK
jgi:hypothetical protein